MTPPGYFTANGATNICPEGHFRDGWLPPDQASACIPCGMGVKADRNDRVVQYLPNGTEVQIAVTTSSADCCEWHLQQCLCMLSVLDAASLAMHQCLAVTCNMCASEV